MKGTFYLQPRINRFVQLLATVRQYADKDDRSTRDHAEDIRREDLIINPDKEVMR